MLFRSIQSKPSLISAPTPPPQPPNAEPPKITAKETLTAPSPLPDTQSQSTENQPQSVSIESPASQFDLHLFDIQTYSQIVSDSSLTSINVGDYVKGNNSGATGFVEASSGQTLTLYQVSGTFVQNETLVVNGIGSSVSIGTFTSYGVEDIKSISDGTFAADSLLSKETILTGPFSLSVDSEIGRAHV